MTIDIFAVSNCQIAVRIFNLQSLSLFTTNFIGLRFANALPIYFNNWDAPLQQTLEQLTTNNYQLTTNYS